MRRMPRKAQRYPARKRPKAHGTAPSALEAPAPTRRQNRSPSIALPDRRPARPRQALHKMPRLRRAKRRTRPHRHNDRPVHPFLPQPLAQRPITTTNRSLRKPQQRPIRTRNVNRIRSKPADKTAPPRPRRRQTLDRRAPKNINLDRRRLPVLRNILRKKKHRLQKPPKLQTNTNTITSNKPPAPHTRKRQITTKKHPVTNPEGAATVRESVKPTDSTNSHGLPLPPRWSLRGAKRRGNLLPPACPAPQSEI